MLEAVGYHAQRQSLGSRERLISIGAVCHDARKSCDFSDPSTVAFAFGFDFEPKFRFCAHLPLV